MRGMRNVPDWARRSLRLSCSIVFLGLLGHLDSTDDIRQACNWAGVTCIVVTAPLMGQVAEVSVFRTLGTMIGGFLGFAVFEAGNTVLDPFWASMCVVGAAPILIVITLYLAHRHNAEQLTKFTQLTYVIVGFSVSAANGTHPPAHTAAVRVCGIIGGVFLSLVLAVIVLPRSATVESCRELKRALKTIVELNHTVWAAASMELPPLETKQRKQGLIARLRHWADSTFSGPSEAGVDHHPAAPSSQQRDADRNKSYKDLEAAGLTMRLLQETEQLTKVGEAEKIFTQIINILAKVESMLVHCSGEIYVASPGGRYIFLPAFLPHKLYGCTLPLFGRWRLPREDMEMVITIVKRLARLQWALLLNFEEGFDTMMQAVLAEKYPQTMMRDLALFIHKTLEDLADAFPNQSTLQIDNILQLEQLVQALMQTADHSTRSHIPTALTRPKRRCFSVAQSYSRSFGAGPNALHTAFTSTTFPAADIIAPVDHYSTTWGGPDAPHSTMKLLRNLPLNNTLRHNSAFPTLDFNRSRNLDMPRSVAVARNGSNACPSPGPLFSLDINNYEPQRASCSRAVAKLQAPVHGSGSGGGGQGDHAAALQQRSSPILQGAVPAAALEDSPFLYNPPPLPADNDALLPTPLVEHNTHNPHIQPKSVSDNHIHYQNLPYRDVLPTIPSDTCLQHVSAALSEGQAGDLTRNSHVTASDARMHSDSISAAAAAAAARKEASDRISAPAVMVVDGSGSRSAGEVTTRYDDNNVPETGGGYSHPASSPFAMADVQRWPEDGGSRRPPALLPHSLPHDAFKNYYLSSKMGVLESELSARLKSHKSLPYLPLESSHGSNSPLLSPNAQKAYDRTGNNTTCPSSSSARDTPLSSTTPAYTPAAPGAQTPNINTCISNPLVAGMLSAIPSVERTLSERMRDHLIHPRIPPIKFPVSEEGKAAMVRWHSFLWLLEELAEELEESVLGIAIIMGQLPHPIQS